jgi:hypothetical protein
MLDELTALGVVALCCDCDARYGTPTEAPNSEAIITGRDAIVVHLSRNRDLLNFASLRRPRHLHFSTDRRRESPNSRK